MRYTDTRCSHMLWLYLSLVLLCLVFSCFWFFDLFIYLVFWGGGGQGWGDVFFCCFGFVFSFFLFFFIFFYFCFVVMYFLFLFFCFFSFVCFSVFFFDLMFRFLFCLFLFLFVFSSLLLLLLCWSCLFFWIDDKCTEAHSSGFGFRKETYKNNSRSFSTVLKKRIF